MLKDSTFTLMKEAYTRIVNDEIKRISFETENVIISAYKNVVYSNSPYFVIEVRSVTSATNYQPGDITYLKPDEKV
jgi:hypothetical protein